MKLLKRMMIGMILASHTAAFCIETNEAQVIKPAEELTNHYNYWAVGVGVPTLLSAKFGHREQKGYHGFEYGVGITPLVYLTEAHVFANALYYPKPNLHRQTYLGAGLRAGGFLELKRAKFGYIAPGFIIGRERLMSDDKQYQFIQVAFGVGALTTEGLEYFPSVSVTFGYGF